jgi:MATE family multidrug resistance protein
MQVGNPNSPASTQSWREHLAATLKLGLPLVGAQLAQISIGVTDTLMIGWLGARELAAATLGSTFFFITLMLGSGFAFAVTPLIAQAAATRDDAQVRRSTRMGLWIVALYAASAMAPLWFAENILIAFGQEAAIAAMAADYLHVMQWALFPALFVMVLRSFFSALQKPRIVLVATIGAALLNAIANYALIFGHFGAPRLELVGAAIASVAASTLSLLVLVVWSQARPATARYGVLARLWRPDWPALRELASLGWPISLTIVAEVALFAVSSLMMGSIGATTLAAHGIALQLASLVFMIPLGFSTAASVRVGHAYALGQAGDVRRAALVVLAIAVGVSLVSAAAFVLFPGPLVSLFLDRSNEDAAEVLAKGAVLLAMAATFQLADGVQAVGAGLLRGVKDMRVSAAIAVVSYWLCGAPAAWLIGFPLGFGGPGIWAGLAIGLAVAALLLNVRFFRLTAFGKAGGTNL